VTAERTGADSYDQAVGRAKTGKGERALVVRYLEPDELVLLRLPAESVGEADGRTLLPDGVVVLVTDRKLLAARRPRGFRAVWEAFTLPFGQLEPEVSAADSAVRVPTSGRRSYRVQLADADGAAALAQHLHDAVAAYRRERMGL
jgi:hypothetical protein